MAEVLTGARGAFVAGAWVAGDGEEIEVRSPASGELLGTVRAASPAQVDHAVRAAQEAFESWRRTSVVDRVELCRNAFALCLERNEEIAQTDHARGRQDDPRVARGDGGVHLRPLPARRRGHAAPRRAGAAVDAGARRTASASWSSRSPSASSRPSRRGTSPSTSPASRSSTAWPPAAPWSGSRRSTRRSARSCSSTCCDDAGFPPGTVNLVHGRGDVGARARAPRGRGLGRVHGLGRDGRAGRARRGPQEPRARAGRQRPADRAAPTPTSIAPRTPPSPAASTWPASAARPPSASSCTNRSQDRSSSS